MIKRTRTFTQVRASPLTFYHTDRSSLCPHIGLLFSVGIKYKINLNHNNKMSCFDKIFLMYVLTKEVKIQFWEYIPKVSLTKILKRYWQLTNQEAVISPLELFTTRVFNLTYLILSFSTTPSSTTLNLMWILNYFNYYLSLTLSLSFSWVPCNHAVQLHSYHNFRSMHFLF